MIKPTFKPKPFKDGSGWYVEVQRPDGSTEYVDQFGSDSEAWSGLPTNLKSGFRSIQNPSNRYDHQTPTHLMPESLKAVPLAMPNVRYRGKAVIPPRNATVILG